MKEYRITSPYLTYTALTTKFSLQRYRIGSWQNVTNKFLFDRDVARSIRTKNGNRVIMSYAFKICGIISIRHIDSVNI